MTRALVLAVSLALSGCCCDVPSASDDSWARAVSRRSGGPQTGGLASGTANVFRLELLAPRGQSQASLAARENAAWRRRAAELELAVTEKKIERGVLEETRYSTEQVGLTEARYREHLAAGTLVADAGVVKERIHSSSGVEERYLVTIRRPRDTTEVSGRPVAAARAFWAELLAQQRAAVAALPAPEAPDDGGPLEVAERWRFVTTFPPVPEAEMNGLFSLVDGRPCGPCQREAAKAKGLFMFSAGYPGVDPATVLPEQLRAGLVLEEAHVSFGGIDREGTESVRPGPGTKLVLTLEADCPATVARVEATLTVGTGGGVIAVPQREALFWHELRGATCLGGDASTRHEVLAGPSGPVETEDWNARQRVGAAEAELARLDALPAP